MTPLPAATTLPSTSTQTWAQTSFLATDVESARDHDPIRDAREALHAAEHAGDLRRQRRALARLTESLREQAQQRGRTPVPKQTDS